jgi:DNA helicase-2/ATP-dependent DNA helicase PcrA
MNNTEAQQRAIITRATHVAVVAGPGAGKTKTLVERIRHMLGSAIDPATVACITFTNGAAREIEKRLVCPMCEGQGAPKTGPDPEPGCAYCNGQPIVLGYAGTVHGLMLRTVRLCHDLIGFPATISVLDEEQAGLLIKQVVDDLRIKPKPTVAQMNAALDLGPEKLLGGKFNTGPEVLAAEYYQRLRRSGLLDFDSLLKFGAMALRAADEHGFALPWRHILWDEFQDSGDDDWAILNALPTTSAFIVGDPDQSIYGFRGARPSRFNSLLQPSAGFEVIALEDNFRCGTAICMSANQLIAHNTDRYAKITKSRSGQTAEVKCWHCQNEQAELRQITEEIWAKSDRWNEIAVLVRTNALVERLAKAIEGAGIRVKVRTSKRVPQDWAMARAALALIASPNNDLLAYWWLERTKGTKEANEIKLRALRAGRSINAQGIGIPYEITVNLALEHLGRLGVGVESLVRIKHAQARLPADATLLELAFALGQPEDEDEGEGVTISTIHAAKGREWDDVYLPAFESGIIPSGAKSASLEEERRLAFVAFTRARTRLVVTHSATRTPQWGGRRPEPAQPSQFITDAWPDLGA